MALETSNFTSIYIQCSKVEASATSAAIECDNSQRAIAGYPS